MKTKPIRYMVIALLCTALIESLHGAETTTVTSIDVALAGGGVLIGQVVDTDGRALVGTEVVLKSGGKEIARCQTAKDGWFRMAGLKGSTIVITAAGTTGHCRAWAPGTAPPAAQQGLLVVAEGDVVRGQHMGRRVPGRRYGRGVSGHGGGMLGLMIDHPVVTAGAVGLAVAVPLAVANDDSPSSP